VTRATEMAKSGQRMWGNIAWWIVVCVSVPFGMYTLPFIYGKFEIYKDFTVSAARGDHHLAGLHVLNNLRTWQVHSSAALLFVLIGPFQFNPSFRNKNPVLHRWLGYVFVMATIVTAVSGATTMPKVSELGPIALTLSRFMGPLTLIDLAISVNAARKKDFQKHRRYMLRSAAIGYAVMYTRFLPPLLQPLLKISFDTALEYSFVMSWALNIGLLEIYIQTYLMQPASKKQARPAVGNVVADVNGKKVT